MKLLLAICIFNFFAVNVLKANPFDITLKYKGIHYSCSVKFEIERDLMEFSFSDNNPKVISDLSHTTTNKHTI
jgi:hypothetical protein